MQPPPTAFQRQLVFLESRVTVVATRAGQQVSNQTMATTQIRPMAINTSADRGSTTRRQLTNLAELLMNLPSSEEPLPHLPPVGRLSQQLTRVRCFLKTPQPPQLIRLRTRRSLQLMTVCEKGSSAQQESTSSKRLGVTFIQPSSMKPRGLRNVAAPLPTSAELR